MVAAREGQTVSAMRARMALRVRGARGVRAGFPPPSRLVGARRTTAPVTDRATSAWLAAPQDIARLSVPSSPFHNPSGLLNFACIPGEKIFQSIFHEVFPALLHTTRLCIPFALFLPPLSRLPQIDSFPQSTPAGLFPFFSIHSAKLDLIPTVLRRSRGPAFRSSRVPVIDLREIIMRSVVAFR